MHFVADFLFQTNDMALNKSHSMKWLGIHALVYSLPFIFFFGILYAVVNGILHFAVDGISSKMTANAWQAGDMRSFFNIIGFDQAIHLTILLLTYLMIHGV